jgi:hypothetical protein
VVLKKINTMERVFIHGLMVTNMLVNLKMAKEIEKIFLLGFMGTYV